MVPVGAAHGGSGSLAGVESAQPTPPPLSPHRGTFDIFVQKDGASLCVGKYDNKGSFGELALMYNTPRAATILATQEGALWALVSPTEGDHANEPRRRPVFTARFSLLLLLLLAGSSHVSQTDR